jgi:hypothetical protein
VSEAKLIFPQISLANNHFLPCRAAVLQHLEGIPQHQAIIVLVNHTANESSSPCSSRKRLLEQTSTATRFSVSSSRPQPSLYQQFYLQDQLSNNHYVHDCRSIETKLNLHSA